MQTQHQNSGNARSVPLSRVLIDRIIAFESGTLTDQESVRLFQELLDSGMILHLQGTYQRVMQRLLAAGKVTSRGLRS